MVTVKLIISKSGFPQDPSETYITQKGWIRLLDGDNEIEPELIPYLRRNRSFHNAVRRGYIILPDTVSLPLSDPIINSVNVETT